MKHTRAFGVIALAIVAGPSHALAAETYPSMRRRAVAPVQADFDALVSARADHPAVRAHVARIGQVDRLVDELAAKLSRSRASLLDDMLGEIDGLAAPKPAKQPRRRRQKGPPPVKRAAGIRGDDVLTEYAPHFATPIDPRGLTEAEQEVIERYAGAVMQAAADHVFELGRIATAVSGESVADVAELCAVIPLLQHRDEQWTPETADRLPKWLMETDSARVIERFALRTARYTAAFSVASAADRQAAERSMDEYLVQAANALTRDQVYTSAVGCWQQLIARADQQGDADAGVSYRFQLAELLADTGQPQLAAEHVSTIVDLGPAPKTYGKAAMLRLKYLYEAGKIDDVVAQGPRLADTPACRFYRPQILYVTWVALRRQNDAAGAKSIQDRFIEDYPRHVLGADMYFATAMAELAASNYDEASRLLEIVEYRYPQSRLHAKVAEIQKRLRSRNPSSATTAGGDS